MVTRRPAPAPLTAEQEALLNSIRLHPAEDTPRLAYADLLDEIGGASNRDRAEFIRLQIQLARFGSDLPDFDALHARASKLLKRHCREWQGTVRIQGVTDVGFHRGFVDSLTTTADVFVRSGAEWWNTNPVTEVRLEEVRGSVERVVAAPYLDNVRDLWLADEFRGRDLRPLAKSPRPGGAGHFPALEVLHIGGWTDDADFDWDGVVYLGACHMPRLRELHLINLLNNDRGAAAVAAAPWFAGLETLDIYTSHIGDAGLATLLASRRENLTDITVGYSRVTAAGLHALAELPADPPLQQLSLVGSRMWCWDRSGPLDPDWDVDPDRVGDVLLKHPELELDLTGCPIPQSTQVELAARFGNRVLVGPVPVADPDGDDAW